MYIGQKKQWDYTTKEEVRPITDTIESVLLKQTVDVYEGFNVATINIKNKFIHTYTVD